MTTFARLVQKEANVTYMELKSTCVLYVGYILYFLFFIFKVDGLSILNVSVKNDRMLYICVRCCIRVRRPGFELLACH